MGDLIVIAVLLLVLGFAAFSLVKNKKKGNCGCGCNSCPKRDLCHPEEK